MVMISDNGELEEEFEMFQIDVDEECKDKLLELSLTYKKNASDMVSAWMAFAMESNKKAADTLLTLENIERMETKQLISKTAKRVASRTPKTPQNPRNKAPIQDDESDLLSSYGSPAATKLVKKRQLTPETTQRPANKRLTPMDRSPAVCMSPAFSQDSVTPSRKYGIRTNAREVVSSFGRSLPDHKWTNTNPKNCVIASYDPENSLKTPYKFMFQKLVDKANVLNDCIEDFASFLKTAHDIEEFSPANVGSQEPVTVVGKICCDSEGRLNARSVLLEGSREISGGRTIPVDLSNLTQYSLFPGQVVGMEGINPTGKAFLPQKMLEVPTPSLPDSNVNSNGALHVLIAAGPFTTGDSLSYEPLTDLVAVIQRTKPDVCILIGPFLDVNHEEVAKLNVEYESFFKNTIKELLKSTENLGSQFVLVPSHRDVHHVPVYPQPPFTSVQDARLHLVSDPCTLSIDGAVFSVTSTDIIKNLSGEEISGNPTIPDRMTRLAQHIISQRSFYPLYPAVRGVNVDYEHSELHSHLSVTPHVLVCPSELRYFIKETSDCLAINPSSLAKGHVGGTYCQLIIEPGQTTQGSLLKQTTARIVRI